MLEGIGPSRPLPWISLSMTIHLKTFMSKKFRMNNRTAYLQLHKLLPTSEIIWYLSCEVVTTNPTACGQNERN